MPETEIVHGMTVLSRNVRGTVCIGAEVENSL